jgi:electron transfer flavoprotein alpha subunit
MASNIWVLAEHWKGELAEVTFELLALGRELAEGLGVSLEAVLLGHNSKKLADALGAADRVFYVEHAALADPSAEIATEALAQLVKSKSPQAVLIPLTNVSWDLIGLLPAELHMPLLNFCQDVQVANGKLEAHCLLYGGKMVATSVATQTPAILAILPGARSQEKGRGTKTPAVEEVAVSIAAPARVQFKQYIEPEAGDVDITQQSVLISVGRGIQTQDNIELAEELAQALGGAVSGSRPIIDQGWLSLSRQVGKSGASVKPKLYLAAGISGAPEHVEGMKNAELIIAINMDAQAPIFNVAHYGIVGDVLELLPLLTEEVRKASAEKAK